MKFRLSTEGMPTDHFWRFVKVKVGVGKISTMLAPTHDFSQWMSSDNIKYDLEFVEWLDESPDVNKIEAAQYLQSEIKRLADDRNGNLIMTRAMRLKLEKVLDILNGKK